MNWKRTQDLVLTLPGLILLVPGLLVVALLVKLEDGGPVLYLQERIGHHGRPFRIWKFRTMRVGADKIGRAITVGEDPRITRIGRWIRKCKVDELPQLVNVIKGEMSLVGPRPEVGRYVSLYTSDQRQVLELMPGITDPASIKYPDEASLLAQSEDPDECYVHEIMPDKIQMNLDYAAKSTFMSDLKLILRTVGLMKGD